MMHRPLLFISSRPALWRPGQEPELEWVLPADFRQQTGVEEWRFPAFGLSVEREAEAQIAAWLGGCDLHTQRCLIVCVSPGSLSLLAGLFPSPWPSGLFLGLMGDGSAAKARGLEIPSEALVYPSMSQGQSQDSEGLLGCLRSVPAFDRALLLKGNGGNLDLAPALQRVCPHLAVLQAYRRDVPSAGEIEAFKQRLSVALSDVADSSAQIAETAEASAAPEGSQQRSSGTAMHAGRRVVFYLTSSEAAYILAPVVQSCGADERAVWVTHPRIEASALQNGLTDVQCMQPGLAVLRQRMLEHLQNLSRC